MYISEELNIIPYLIQLAFSCHTQRELQLKHGHHFVQLVWVSLSKGQPLRTERVMPCQDGGTTGYKPVVNTRRNLPKAPSSPLRMEGWATSFSHLLPSNDSGHLCSANSTPFVLLSERGCPHVNTCVFSHVNKLHEHLCSVSITPFVLSRERKCQ